MTTYYIINDDDKAIAEFNTDAKLNVRMRIIYAYGITENAVINGDLHKISCAKKHANASLAYVSYDETEEVAYVKDYRN